MDGYRGAGANYHSGFLVIAEARFEFEISVID
jgi:hypothetical protein